MKNKLFVFIHGFVGNGFEDDGHEIYEVKVFNEKVNAIKYSIKYFDMKVRETLDIAEQDEIERQKVARELNGFIREEYGNWEISPESTIYGIVKEEE